ncbi:MAG: CdaR family protein [Kiritimatiellaceae bacterium]|nr:CdaR family protein [Kiritimatiellaceae bacterium]
MKNKQSSGFWSQLNTDKWLILFCIVLAFIGWQGIRKNIGFELTVSNIIVDIDVPEGWAVWEKSVNRVNIEFNGSREDIRYLNSEQLKVVIPVPDPKYGEELTIELSEKYLRNPTGAKVKDFSPSEIVLRLDQETERKLPIKATFDGELPEGLEIERIVCTPASVRVSGARQVLEGMENIHTEPILLKDRQSSFKESIPVALPEASRMVVDPNWVSVEFFLEAHTSTETFEKIPVRTMCSPGDLRNISVSPQTISVTVSGQQQRIEQIRTTDVFAYVSCYDLLESTAYDMPVVIDLPEGLQLVKTDPSVVHIEIGKEN